MFVCRCLPIPNTIESKFLKDLTVFESSIEKLFLCWQADNPSFEVFIYVTAWPISKIIFGKIRTQSEWISSVNPVPLCTSYVIKINIYILLLRAYVVRGIDVVPDIARFCRRGFVLRAFVTARFCLRAFVCALLSYAFLLRRLLQ